MTAAPPDHSLRHLCDSLPALLKRTPPHGADFFLQPQSRSSPIGSLQRPHILLQLSVPPVFGSLQQANADFAVNGFGLRRLGLYDAIEEDCLLVQQGALVQSVARVDVEREVDDGSCEGEAAELCCQSLVVWFGSSRANGALEGLRGRM